MPNNRRPARHAASAQTSVLERRYLELQKLPHGHRVIERLEEWKWPWAGRSAADKQIYLEPLIDEIQREPVADEDILVFLLIVVEPLRRGISSPFRRARSGLEPIGPWASASAARTFEPGGIMRRDDRSP